MRMLQRKYLVGGAVLALLGAGVAQAATQQIHTMNLAAPDEVVVQVQYSGDVPPQVQVVPAAMTQEAAPDPFASMAQISAMMDAQMAAMMQRAALMQHQAAHMQQRAVQASDSTGAPGVTLVGDMPQGMHVTYYSSTTDAHGCTRATTYNSDGSGAAPQVVQAASDGCDAAKPTTQAIPAKAEAPVEQAPAPGRKV
ncbi:hypothetical protein [Novosphingobium sp. Leaf2]|uniref:hypothetical protein n=1 Tax=Novosphingobium sp. Leaf2 TaxID=1735670 RepID=UPI0006F33AD0|nr:hypothetical protein [Novosphingobium sp. Leaf2]KQM22041.1 hypothetical protein ASE49_01670 [Novosphingobium sp. Leaf2]